MIREKVNAYRTLMQLLELNWSNELFDSIVLELELEIGYIPDENKAFAALWILVSSHIEDKNCFQFRKNIQSNLKDINRVREYEAYKMLTESDLSIYSYEVGNYDSFLAKEMLGWDEDIIYDLTKSASHHIGYGSGIILKDKGLVRKFDNLTPDDSGEEPEHIGGKEEGGIYIAWKSKGFESGYLWVLQKLKNTTKERIHNQTWPIDEKNRERKLIKMALSQSQE